MCWRWPRWDCLCGARGWLASASFRGASRSFVPIWSLFKRPIPGVSPLLREQPTRAMSIPEADWRVSAGSDSPPARVAAIRQRIAQQRAGIAAQFKSLIAPRPDPRPPKPLPALGIGLVIVAALVLTTSRRARVITQAAVSTGWLAWRALRLARAFSASFSTRPSRDNAKDQGRTRAS